MRADPRPQEPRSSAANPGRPPGRARFSTRRRLVAAFSIVLAVSVASLAIPLAGLRRMEATFVEWEEHEEQERVALQLEAAVRALCSYEAELGAGGSVDLAAYERARVLTLELTRTLRERIDEPEATALMVEIAGDSARLEQRIRESLAPRAGGGGPGGRAAPEPGYPLVFRMEQKVDRLFEQMHRETTAYRRMLVALERDVWRWTGALVLAMPVLVAAAVLYLSRSVARPLARLSEGAAAVAGGDLDARIRIDTPDEFGALAFELNAMTAALKRHGEKLVESEKLAGVGRLAAGFAHEMNNPLQVMLGYLSLNRDVPDRRLAEQLSAIERETLRCKDIVDSLLELSRPTVRLVPVDLRTLCEDVATALRASILPSTVALSVDGGARALGDPVKLRQVVFNLVKNAAEAVGEEGRVEVQVAERGGEATVSVRDTGPGVSAEARSRIFEPFFTTKPTGKGLGLAVSRSIAIAHGGDVEFRDAEPGGAVFTLRLPRAPEGRS